MTERHFLAKYSRRLDYLKDRLSLTEVETEHGHDCVFLDRVSLPGKALCRVHEARPMQCRTWPWWPEVVRSERSWEAAAQRCEGMNRGALVPVEAIRIERARTPRD